MKKGLSVLLIAAALFGFYGGAVNLNDVLACKDYWEEEGEKSTADMNKLEDGLNQLKDNEQAYLDGLDAVAEGEEALAQGEQDYADGQATLAQGEADYAAAPAKLADARKILAAGQAAIDKGEADLDSLNSLIDGIEQVLNGYPEWKSGYEQLRIGRINSIKKPADTSDLQAVLTAYATKASNADAVAALTTLGKAKAAFDKQNASSFTNEQYDGFNTYLTNTVAGLDQTNTFFDNIKSAHNKVASKYAAALLSAQTAAQKYSAVASAGSKAQAAGKAYADIKDSDVVSDEEKNQKYNEMIDAQAAYQTAVSTYGELGDLRSALNDELAACSYLASDVTDNVAINMAINVFIASKDADMAKNVSDALSAVKDGLTVAGNDSNAAAITPFLTAVGTIPVALSNVNSGIQDTQDTTIKNSKDLANQWINGYAQITDPSGKAVKGQKTLVGGVAKIIGGVLDSKNDELINGMNKAASAVGFTPKDFTPDSTSKLAKDMASGSKLENFYNDMNKIESGFKKVLPALKTKAKDGANTLAAGKKTLKNGKAQYAQGLADYKAAPAKLAAGRAALAEGLQKLMDGRKELAAGKDKLAEYEDGEQQVRDGLATLMGTEANGGLESILDRRSGDDDFDNGDKHLDLDEGLDAVDVGRGYQADSGELITKEITNRAIGTAAGLGAAALAVLAAILSFLKKNKGAGVLAILSAAAGGAGIAAGTSAGMEFSSIAGSAVGATPWIAFGILAGVAAVHAIAHFASKEA
ncbi:MAG: hypothetical protein IJY32_01370 [Mogibacterium sp.]|nr:hypothetical protein [Mogibacterium sp.]